MLETLPSQDMNVASQGDHIVVQTSEHMVRLYIESNVNSFRSERKFSKSMTVDQFRTQLELITGAESPSMKIKVEDHRPGVSSTALDVCKIGMGEMGDVLLGSLPIDSDMTIVVHDSNKSKSEFEDLSRVEKFELSETEYAKRGSTVRSFLKQNKLGRFNKQNMETLKAAQQKFESEQEELASKMKIGDRCQIVAVPSKNNKSMNDAGNHIEIEQPTLSDEVLRRVIGSRGAIRYIGKRVSSSQKSKSEWKVGIEFDEPMGDNDGTFSIEGGGGKSEKLFSCLQKHGFFSPLVNVKIGDFPPEDDLLQDTDDDEI